MQAYTKEKQRYSEKRPRGRPIVRQASKNSLSTISSSDSDLYSLDPEESGDEQQVQRIPRRIAVAQKDIARIAIVRKAAAKKAAAKKAKSRIIAKSTRLTRSGAVVQQRRSKRKRKR